MNTNKSQKAFFLVVFSVFFVLAALRSKVNSPTNEKFKYNDGPTNSSTQGNLHLCCIRKRTVRSSFLLSEGISKGKRRSLRLDLSITDQLSGLLLDGAVKD